MKPRPRRVAIAAAALGVVVVAVAVVLNWTAVRDHVEAWHFQVTRETVTTIEPNPGFARHCWDEPPSGGGWTASPVEVLECLATLSGVPVVIDAGDRPAVTVWGITGKPSPGDLAGYLASSGYRVLEQRFPRHAYVVMRDEGTTP
jgi:hypothetical protein